MPSAQGVTKNLVFAIVAGAVGSAFQHGYNTGVVNAPQALVEEFINATYSVRFEEPAPHSTVTFIFSILVAVFCVGGVVGAGATAYVAERAGRRGGLLLGCVLVFVAAGLMGLARTARSYEMMVLGRFVIGVNAGLNAGLAPMYLAEISPLHLRGAVGTIYQLVITISILISQVLGLPSLLGTRDRWPYMFGRFYPLATVNIAAV
ncbi:SLC2A4 [Cordylochernes scorpioides]|uniref:SLC2A4 n=1 Tax=Cordylochernes scorpioides TaxID=51811 RepID=A0ABY6KBW9_9ARAC|nr:SLC2A4 [Cordylochernes scorpioides]